MQTSYYHLSVHSNIIEGPLLLSALTAQLALAKQAILVSAVLVELVGRFVLTTFTAPLLTHSRLCQLQFADGFTHLILRRSHTSPVIGLLLSMEVDIPAKVCKLVFKS